MTNIGPNRGSKNSGNERFDVNDTFDTFFGFRSQSTDDSVVTLASLGIVKYDKACLLEYKDLFEIKVEDDERIRLEE